MNLSEGEPRVAPGVDGSGAPASKQAAVCSPAGDQSFNHLSSLTASSENETARMVLGSCSLVH